MTGVQNKPLWSVASETRRQVEPSLLGESVVHYSIPSVDAYGIGQVECTVDIHSAKLLLRGGEVLISKLNPRKSRVVIVRRDDLPVVSSTEFIGLQAGPHLEDRFLAYFLQSEAVRQNLDARVQSVTRSHQRVAPEDVLHLHIDLPGLGEQRRIADFLDAETSRIDRLVALQSAVASKLRDREVVQRDAAIDRLIESEGVAPLRRFVWSVDQGSSPQCDSTPAAEGEWGVLKVSCLRPGIFNPGENKRLPDDVEPNRRSEVRAGDLLITRANTPQLVGSTAVVDSVRSRLLLPDKIFRVRLTARMSPQYVAEVAAGTRVRALCAASSNGASQSMANIRFEEVKAWPIPVVDLQEQERFVREMSRGRELLSSLHDAVDRQLRLLNERRQALITAAITGQFDVTTASGRNLTQGV
ncbi:hypothetical protein B7C42_07161 [Nocardia cerradoensis]|uniref:Uncharacterized protein n=1 Tax=Nocardia cerradoensis TaxID=85688 RepID=A0A231GVS8_9NOCA|nr:restriction endonuclease subunit S [Nocardia cerradoensis]OXR40737.1 hypothetical protein B7C42_07161 [Nocardia cerradoensis]